MSLVGFPLVVGAEGPKVSGHNEAVHGAVEKLEEQKILLEMLSRVLDKRLESCKSHLIPVGAENAVPSVPGSKYRQWSQEEVAAFKERVKLF